VCSSNKRMTTTDFLRAQSTTSLDAKNSVIVRVAFPEFSTIKTVRCVKSLPIGEIKSVFHSQCKFEDDLYAIFMPAVDAKGGLSIVDGKWCDDAKTVKECNLHPMDKLILARRNPTGKASTPDAKKNRRLSRRILGFFGSSESKSSSNLMSQPSQSQGAVEATGGGTGSVSEEDQEFLKFANSFASRAGRSNSNAAVDSSPLFHTSSSQSVASPSAVVPSSSSSSSLMRQRRMTFDMKNIGNLMSMEVETNPAERRRQLVSFLSRFIEARISIDELICSGIIDLEPPPALCDSPVEITFVEQLFEWILKNGMVEGIFRISGPSQDVDALTSILNKGLMFDLTDSLSPHLVASVLKKYLRDRPFSTVPYRCFRSAILIHDSLPEKEKFGPFSVDECRSFIEHLPDDKQDLFRMVIRYLKKITAFREETKMNDSNLAIVFAPVLMRCRGDGLSLFSESDRQTNFLVRMIEVIDEIEKGTQSSTATESAASGSAATDSVDGEERSVDKEKRKHHKHRHHKHHKHHSRSRSRRKSESADSSPVISPLANTVSATDSKSSAVNEGAGEPSTTDKSEKTAQSAKTEKTEAAPSKSTDEAK